MCIMFSGPVKVPWWGCKEAVEMSKLQSVSSSSLRLSVSTTLYLFRKMSWTDVVVGSRSTPSMSHSQRD